MAWRVTPVVVDANVAVKWFVESELSPQARALIPQHRFTAPTVFLAETANALWKYVRLDGYSVHDAAEALMTLGRTVELSNDAALAPEALRLASRLNHPAYDCFYLALAQQGGLPLLTADRKLAALSERAGLSTIRLESLKAE